MAVSDSKNGVLYNLFSLAHCSLIRHLLLHDVVVVLFKNSKGDLLLFAVPLRLTVSLLTFSTITRPYISFSFSRFLDRWHAN